MRITITGMIALMILTLLAGIVAVRVLMPERRTAGGSVVVVLVDGAGLEDPAGRLLDDPPPALAGLMGKGVSFLDCKTPSPWYPAAAASLLTGLYPEEHGLTRGHPRLSLRAQTLAEDRAAAGYHTYLFAGEDSLLARTGVLQGFQHRAAAGEGGSAGRAALDFIAAAAGRFPFFALVEIDARRCRGAPGLYGTLDRFAAGLEETGYLERNILVLCAPGRSSPDDPDPLGRADIRSFLLLAGPRFEAAPAEPFRKPASLVDAYPAVKKTLGSGTFDVRDSIRTGHAVMEEVESPRGNPREGGTEGFPSRFRRVVWFDDLPFRCLVDEEGGVRFQDAEGAPLSLSPEREALARRRLAVFLAGLRPVGDLPASLPAGIRGGER